MADRIEQNQETKVDFFKRYELSRKLGYGRLSSFIFSLQTWNKNLETVTNFFIDKAHKISTLDHQNFIQKHHFKKIRDKREFDDSLKNVFCLQANYFVSEQQQIAALANLAFIEFGKLKYDKDAHVFIIEEEKDNDSKIEKFLEIGLRNNPYSALLKKNDSLSTKENKETVVKHINKLYQTSVIKKDIIERRDFLLKYLGGKS